ncbi:glutaminyl-peptide cyclotransferase [Sphingobacterium sp. E70]|uniref:glutaminyl-peptide cyclotransferase n=1 Tax=Sphingobacterium sp. E70 TaxID=2853439 RepID=UPI00359CB135
MPSDPPRILKYRIVNTYPHDIKAFTQGLEFFGENLMESTGNGVGLVEIKVSQVSALSILQQDKQSKRSN